MFRTTWFSSSVPVLWAKANCVIIHGLIRSASYCKTRRSRKDQASRSTCMLHADGSEEEATNDKVRSHRREPGGSRNKDPGHRNSANVIKAMLSCATHRVKRCGNMLHRQRFDRLADGTHINREANDFGNVTKFAIHMSGSQRRFLFRLASTPGMMEGGSMSVVDKCMTLLLPG